MRSHFFQSEFMFACFEPVQFMNVSAIHCFLVLSYLGIRPSNEGRCCKNQQDQAVQSIDAVVVVVLHDELVAFLDNL